MSGYLPRGLPGNPTQNPINLKWGMGIGGFAAGFWTGVGVANLVEEKAKKLDKSKDEGNGNTLRAVSGIIGAGTAAAAIAYPLAGAAFFVTTFFATGGIIVAASAAIGLLGGYA